MRTTSVTVQFFHPFLIGKLEDQLPPGKYLVEEDEEESLDASISAFRRIRTIIQLPRSSSKLDEARSVTITPVDLIEALARDRATPDAADRPSPEAPEISDNGHTPGLSRMQVDQMQQHGITGEVSRTYSVDGFRYSHLRDAVAQAKRSAAKI